eukprot:scaffold649924_cov43-Prasinocladus_malaysianus.AAC.1
MAVPTSVQQTMGQLWLASRKLPPTSSCLTPATAGRAPRGTMPSRRPSRPSMPSLFFAMPT